MIKLVTLKQKLYINEDYEVITLQESLSLLETLSEISVDTETTGLNSHTEELLLTQLGNYKYQVVIDNTTVDILHYKELLETKFLIFQNAQFDLQFLFKHNIYPIKVYDTLLAECIITGGFGDEQDKKDVKAEFNLKVAEKFIDRKLGLDDLTLKYCNTTLDKSIRSDIATLGLTNRVIKYAADDIKYLGMIKQAQLDIIKSYTSLYNIDGKIIDLEMDAVLVFSRMCYNGIILNDVKYRKEVLDIVKKDVAASLSDLDAIVLNEPMLKRYHYVQGDLFFQARQTEINWNSSTQKLKILQVLDPQIESTNDQEIRKRFKLHDIFPIISKYNKSRKLESSFGEKFLSFINKKTKRMHPSVWQILNY